MHTTPHHTTHNIGSSCRRINQPTNHLTLQSFNPTPPTPTTGAGSNQPTNLPVPLPPQKTTQQVLRRLRGDFLQPVSDRTRVAVHYDFRVRVCNKVQ